MGRSILIVNATQVIKSESNPYGIYSVVTGFPKVFDSGNDGDLEQNMKNAKSAYFAQLSSNYANANPNRIMMTVTLTAVDGKQFLNECIGGFETEMPAEEIEE